MVAIHDVDGAAHPSSDDDLGRRCAATKYVSVHVIYFLSNVTNIYIDSPMIPVVLLPFSVLVGLSTATCIFTMAHWDAPFEVKRTLASMYAPYVILRKCICL